MDQRHSPPQMKGEFHNSERSEGEGAPPPPPGGPDRVGESGGVAPEVTAPPFSAAVQWEDPQFLPEQEEAEGRDPGIPAFLPA